MLSPFPGMDPYIEMPRIWTDFHGDLAAEMRAELNRHIRPTYYVMLSRATHRPHVSVWPIPLTARLPEVPVPLLEPDPDVVLDLGAIVASV